ncbi:MAG: hypothetical protein U9R72_17355 [Chloroflexota bacterium]|nr:hypothetical protein [Chloroflexota bacterium]
MDRRLVVALLAAVAVVVLVVGSCAAGAVLLAPQIAEVLPRMEWPSGGTETVKPLVTEEATPRPEETRASVPESEPAASPTPIPGDILEGASAEERLVANVYERVAPSVVIMSHNVV